MAESPLTKLVRLIGGVALMEGGLGHQVLGQLLIANTNEAAVAGAAVVIAATSRQKNAVAQVALRTAAPAIAGHILLREEESRIQRREALLSERERAFAVRAQDIAARERAAERKLRDLEAAQRAAETERRYLSYAVRNVNERMNAIAADPQPPPAPPAAAANATPTATPAAPLKPRKRRGPKRTS